MWYFKQWYVWQHFQSSKWVNGPCAIKPQRKQQWFCSELWAFEWRSWRDVCFLNYRTASNKVHQMFRQICIKKRARMSKSASGKINIFGNKRILFTVALLCHLSQSKPTVFSGIYLWVNTYEIKFLCDILWPASQIMIIKKNKVGWYRKLIPPPTHTQIIIKQQNSMSNGKFCTVIRLEIASGKLECDWRVNIP